MDGATCIQPNPLSKSSFGWSANPKHSTISTGCPNPTRSTNTSAARRSTNCPIYGTWYYLLGRDEPLISQNLKIGAAVNAKLHNVMIFTRHADGHVIGDDAIADCYLRTWNDAARLGLEVTFELHVNMWSEDFRRVRIVAEKSATAGASRSISRSTTVT